MCTAVSFTSKDHYFGRNMDYYFSYEESVTVTPRNYEFKFRKVAPIKKHYGMIGMAYIMQDYPLYYEATNERGLSMAGLNFPGNATYYEEKEGKDNITPFEFIPWVLSQCETVAETEKLLERINLVNINFSEVLPLSPLHWIISDRDKSIVVETLAEGMKVYDNPVGVLTNNPPFDYHMTNLTNYMHLSNMQPDNKLLSGRVLTHHSQGMGALGLPGDISSPSRFIRAVFTRENSVCPSGEKESVSQFFHILGAVENQRGAVKVEGDKYDITIYASCCNTDKGVYYYHTYDNSTICAVDMHREDLDSDKLSSYPIISETTINYQN